MEPIPGSATEEKAGVLAGIEALNTTYPIGSGWGSERRWAKYNGEKPPMTPPRVRAIADKRECVVLVKRDDGTLESIGGGIDGHSSKRFEKLRNLLAEFAFGDELKAGYASGALFPYALENRRGKEYVPTQAKWKLRSTHLAVLAVIAGAMIGLKKRGVVIAHHELAALKTSSGRSVIGLKERQLGTVVRELCAWGLLRRRPTAVARGKASSFRANVYQLTTLTACVYRLKLPAACGDLPEPVLRDLPATKTEPTGSGPIRQELPGNPETPLRGRSPEEHEALHRIDHGSTPVADTATRAQSERTAVATAACAAPSSSEQPSRAIAARGPAGAAATCERHTASTRPTNPPGVHSLKSSSRTDALSDGSMSREVQTPLLCPTGGDGANDELALAERRVGDAAGMVRRGDFDDRYVEGDPAETARRLEIARRRVIAEEKAQLKQRQAAQLELVRERESARRNKGGGRAVLDRDDERASTYDPTTDGSTIDMLRRYRESMRDEDAELARTFRANRAVKVVEPPAADVELADTIESIWRNRFGAPTVIAQVELEKMRGPKKGPQS